MIVVRGRVTACRAHRIEARVRGARLGERITIGSRVPAIVTAIQADGVVLAPLSDARSVALGDEVTLEEFGDLAVLGSPLFGRAIDGLGRPLDERPAPDGLRMSLGLFEAAPLPSQRRALKHPLWTGIRAIDGLLTVARGMRLGIFGPPGTGKSHLLEAIACGVDADAVVVALVGERGAEIERHLTILDERTTIVCAPADRVAGERVVAAELAFAQAAYLRDAGLDVVVIFDSLARYAHALREVALASGESPGRGGFPPSVFTRLGILCERAGATASGSITLLATVLSEAADPSDPLSEAARSHLDGHLILSRRRAERGAFPAIDVTASLSRPMPRVVDEEHLEAARRVRGALARLEETREARELGIGAAEPSEAALEAFLRQGADPVSPESTLASLHQVADRL
jgi:ATP synthase in type III secretion protein N